MPVNVLLVRWTDGWREVADPDSIATYGRREALLGLGAIQSPQEVDRVARMQLALFADQRTAIATDIDPRFVNDRPYRDFYVGDTITVPDYGTGTISQRVRAITGAEDENGEITYSVELGDLILEEQERTLLTIAKLADGTLSGESHVATPVSGIYNIPKVFGSMPFPRGMVLTGTPDTEGHSAAWAPDGPVADFHLVSFTAVPLGDGPVDGEPPYAQLWQNNPGEGSHSVAQVDIGLNYSAGTTYTGTISTPDLSAGTWNDDVSQQSIAFRTGGTFGSPVALTATFSNGSGTHVLAWGGG